MSTAASSSTTLIISVVMLRFKMTWCGNTFNRNLWVWKWPSAVGILIYFPNSTLSRKCSAFKIEKKLVSLLPCIQTLNRKYCIEEGFEILTTYSLSLNLSYLLHIHILYKSKEFEVGFLLNDSSLTYASTQQLWQNE